MNGSKLYRWAVGSALALSSMGAQAIVFGPGLNDIEIINRENLYRAQDDCVGDACLAAQPDDPVGYQRVNPAINNNVLVGDIFAGVFASRSVTNQGTTTLPGLGTVWNEDNTPAGGIDTFTGYFAQEVKEISLDVDGTTDRVILGTLTVADPFGELVAGEVARAYVDNAGLANTAYVLDGAANLVTNVIASMTDGALWAALSVGADALGLLIDDDGYVYSQVDLATPGAGTNFTGDFFTAWEISLEGPAYNAGTLVPINDSGEGVKGGSQPGDPFTTNFQNLAGFCNAVADAYACNDLVGNGQLSPVTVVSRFAFESEDPLRLHRAVPEPASLALLGAALAGLSLVGWSTRSRRR